MELFLTSSVDKAAQSIVKKKDLAKGNKLVFIRTAAEAKTGDKSWEERDRQALVDAGFGVSDYTITGKSREELETFLKKFDYIYFSGGETSYLLLQSQKSGLVSLIKDLVAKGKIYISTSAGSIIAGPRLPDYFEAEGLENRNCYGLVNFTILPHWGSEKFREKYLDHRIEIAYKNDQVPLLLLTDDQYVHVIDGQTTIIDVKNESLSH